ncbi:MAG: hypothetical protein KC708_26965, partial [Anaerolineae bacterium]|nr:hypothetical protein [Anaerolineae bacterium]
YGFSYGDLTGSWQPLAFDSDTSVLNRLFAATVPMPRVPVIPGPDLPIVPTGSSPDSLPPSLEEFPVEPTLDASSMPTETDGFPPDSTAIPGPTETIPSAEPIATTSPADLSVPENN